jgi:hypothetical protein
MFNIRLAGVRKPLFVIVIIALACVAFGAMLFKGAFIDEVFYVDPGANMALGRGFTSSASPTAPPSASWGSSTPGMPLIFAGWFKVFGFGLIQARALAFLIHLSGAMLLLRWLKLKLELPDYAQLIVLAACFFQPSLGRHLLYGRLEIFALLLFAWFLHLAWPTSSRLSLGLGICFGFCVGLLGLQFAAYYLLAVFALLLAHRNRPSLTLVAAIFIGVLGAFLCIRIGYGITGAWDTFLQARAAHYGRTLSWVATGYGRFIVNRDLLPLFIISMAFSFLAWRDRRLGKPITWHYPVLAAACFWLVPLVIGTVGIYYSHYGWMVGMPMTVLLLFALKERSARARQWGWCILTLYLLSGVAYHLWIMPARFDSLRHRANVAAHLQQVTKPEDHIAADYDLFYEAKAARPNLYFRVLKDAGVELGFKQEQFMPAEERALVRWIVAPPKVASAMADDLGGEWRLEVLFPSHGVTSPPGSGVPFQSADFAIYSRK